MSLASPNVTLPISTWTKKLLVTGAQKGATILVRAVGPAPRDVVKSPGSGGGADWVDLLPGVSLKPGDLLVARQVLGADSSDWTPKGSEFPVNTPEANPANLLAVTLNTYPWECSEFVQLAGAEPGATIEVFIGGTLLGSAVAPLGWARFGLTNKLTAPGPVRVRQNTPIGPGPMTDLPVVSIPFPRTTPVPPPQVTTALHGCEDLVPLAAVYDGSTVILDLSTGESYSLGAPISNPTVQLPAPLKWNKANPQTVTLKQRMPKCERDGAPGAPVSVGPPDAGTPSVWGLCKGNPRITVAGLNSRALATVRIFLNGAEFRVFTVHGESVHSCDVDPALDSGDIYAIQEICGQPSPQSNTVTIIEEPTITTRPQVIGPLFSCARSVRVKDVHPGAEARLYVKSKSTGVVNEAARKTFLSSVDNLDVSPLLKLDDEVWVLAIGCGTSLESVPHEIVKAHPAIAAPTIRNPVIDGDTSVVVLGAIATATIYVYVRDNQDHPWELAATKPSADGGFDFIALDNKRILKTGQEVAAAQYYCQVFSGQGAVTKVLKKPPLAPKLISPSAGQKDVATSVTFTWSDPGASTQQKADSFDILVLSNSSVVDSAGGLTTTSYSIAPGKLKIGTAYTWSVKAKNSTGYGPASQSTFTTLAPKPVLTSYDQTTMHLKGTNFPPNTVFTLHYKFQIDGTLYFGSEPFTSDGRQGTFSGTFTSDATGNVDVAVDLYYPTVPTLVFLVSGPGGGSYHSISGPLKGEKVELSAEYKTASIGIIHSNPLDFIWTKDTTLGG